MVITKCYLLKQAKVLGAMVVFLSVKWSIVYSGIATSIFLGNNDADTAAVVSAILAIITLVSLTYIQYTIYYKWVLNRFREASAGAIKD